MVATPRSGTNLSIETTNKRVGNNVTTQAAILVAHYESVRQEIMERMRQRDQYVKLFGTVVVVTIGLLSAKSEFLWILTGIPFLAFLASAMYAQTDIGIGSLGRYLASDYTAAIGRLAATAKAGALPHWDGSEAHHEFIQNHSQARYQSVALIFAGPAAIASVAFVIVAQVSLLWRALIGLGMMAMAILAARAVLSAGRERVSQLAHYRPKTDDSSSGETYEGEPSAIE